MKHEVLTVVIQKASVSELLRDSSLKRADKVGSHRHFIIKQMKKNPFIMKQRKGVRAFYRKVDKTQLLYRGIDKVKAFHHEADEKGFRAKLS